MARRDDEAADVWTLASSQVPSSVSDVRFRGGIGSEIGATDADFALLRLPLPSEVERLKGAGRVEDAARVCECLLASGAVPELVARLRAEVLRLSRLVQQYGVSPEDALAQLQVEAPGLSRDDLDALVARGRIDWRFFEDGPRFLNSYLDALRLYAPEVPGLRGEIEGTDGLQRLLARMHEDGGAAREVTVRARLDILDVPYGSAVRAFLPIPADAPQVDAVELLDATPGGDAARADAPARTISWASRSERSFSVTYRYRISAPYVDLWSDAGIDRACKHGIPTAGMPAAEPDSRDLAELEPHIVFTPLLRATAERVRRSARSQMPLELSRAAYDFVTERVDYRYQPSYAQLDCIPDMCLSSRSGDCGVMAVTFIALCRYLGVPARWQSGLYAAPHEIGSHDWAMFFIEGMGWLWADCSFGSAARREGDEPRRRHYFGNIDPWRAVFNREFFAPFEAPLEGVRWDPFDNQRGEASVDGRGLDSTEMLRGTELLAMKELPWPVEKETLT